MKPPKNPSDYWLNKLILLVQECSAETGMAFGEFLAYAFAGLPRDASNYGLVQQLKTTFDTAGRQRIAQSDEWPEPKAA